jgi:Cof subfamily protein (haloacid dehalogenase superfamily)
VYDELDLKAPAEGACHIQMIKLVAIDLDGTLLNDSKRVSDQTAEALRCLPSRGVKVVIASARPPRSVRHIYHLLNLDTLQINYNGALIWNEPEKKSVFHCPLPGPLVARMVEIARDWFDDVIVGCEVMDRWFTDRVDDAHTTETGRMFKPDVIAPLETFIANDTTKLMFLAEPKVISELEPLLYKTFGEQVQILQTDDNLLQIMSPQGGKSTALQWVADHYDIPMQQVMAIGDAPNDVGMLQLAGVAVAMDNARTIVKDVADWIAPSNNNHGVHAALVKYGLCS